MQARSRLAAFAYIGALLAEPGDRKSCWQLAEDAGHCSPRRMQALLAEHVWDWKAALAALQQFITARLGDPEAILALDETAELKKEPRRWGTARQYAGITGHGCLRRRRDDAGHGMGDPLVRPRLQGPSRLPVGVDRHRLAAALGAEPPQPGQPR